MMNDKDLQIEKNLDEIIEAFKERLAQIDEEMTEEQEHKDKELKPEKVSRSEKRRVADMLDRINNNENVFDMLGFISFKDGTGFLFGKNSEYTFETVTFMIIEIYEKFRDNVDFDEFLDDLIHNAKVTRTLIRGLKNERN